MIDDEESVLNGLRRMIRIVRPTWNVVTTIDGHEGLQLLKEQTFDTVISDMSMPDIHGLTVLSEVRDLQPHVTRIALTGYVDEQWKAKHNFNHLVAQVVLLKPCLVDDLVGAIEFPDKHTWSVARSAQDHELLQSRPEPRKSRWSDSDEVTFS